MTEIRAVKYRIRKTVYFLCPSTGLGDKMLLEDTTLPFFSSSAQQKSVFLLSSVKILKLADYNGSTG